MNLSIHFRLHLSAAIILFMFLGLTATVLDKTYDNYINNTQRENLRTQIYTLLATADINGNNALVLPREITEPRLNVIDSTLHARVFTTDNKIIWQSQSMLNTVIPFPDNIQVGVFQFSQSQANEQVDYTLLSFATSWETEQGEITYIFQLAENNKNITNQISAFRKNVWLWMIAMGALLLMFQAFILRWSLRPLRCVADDLIEIEQGNNTRLSGTYPKELLPLTSNLNQLLDSSQKQLARYRDALGNMAHSLKTPMTVLHGIIETSDITQKETASEQLNTINTIVEYQLQRASTAGRLNSHSHIKIQDITGKIIRSLDKVYHEKNVKHTLNITENLQAKLDEGDLYEILGNLLDNAYKWCKTEFIFTAKENKTQLQIIIEDDGPGINKKDCERILLRGQRADQNTPGHGLGLTMISDTLLLYQGSMKITDSKLGGAKVIIEL